MSERRGTPAGPLRIAGPVGFGSLHLGPALYPFLKEHPEIDLTLDLDDRMVNVAADGYDAVVRSAPIQDERYVVKRLAPSRRVLVASHDYLDRNGHTEIAGRPGKAPCDHLRQSRDRRLAI